jgi:hypothetical protein
VCLIVVGAGQEIISGRVEKVMTPWQMQVNGSIVYLDGLTQYNYLNSSTEHEITAWADIWLQNKTVSCEVVGHDHDGWPLVRATDGYISINSAILERIKASIP